MPKISGMVVEQWTRRPVVGAVVKIINFTALTDQLGRFSIETPRGVVQMRVTHRDFHPYVKSLEVLMAGDVGIIPLTSKVVAL